MPPVPPLPDPRPPAVSPVLLQTASRRAAAIVTGATLAIFLVHALGYLYFFVDDEGIPFVYAQQLLEGRGLSYNHSDGPSEGFSDFLHVVAATGVLWSAQRMGATKLSVFFIGKAASLLAGVAILLLVGRALRRRGADATGLTIALVFLALSGPLAVWSCSSLEAVPFALSLTVLLAALVEYERPAAHRVALAAGSVALLLRIDGIVYVGMIVSAFLASGAVNRRTLLRQVAVPLAILCVAFHAWRTWYFQDWLPAPLAAKVWFKLVPHANIETKMPPANYLLRLMGAYDWMLMPMVLAAAWRRRRDRVALSLVVCIAMMCAYFAVVGDWMFGFRFAVTALPALALLAGEAFSGLSRVSVRIALVTVVAAWMAHSAVAFARTYEATQHRGNWWRTRALDPARYFGEYYALYEAARPMMRAGDVTVFNQAGFVPFMLDLDNIDDLGICSEIVAEMPTTDVKFTEVGRYSPMTDKPVLRSAEAYLLSRQPKFVIGRTDLLKSANMDRVPRVVLGRHFARFAIDASGRQVIYRPAGPLPPDYQHDPTLFRENVLHPSYLASASADGRPLPADLLHALPFLAEHTAHFVVEGARTFDLVFASTDLPVYQFYAWQLRARSPTTLIVDLFSADGRRVFDTAIAIVPGQPGEVLIELPSGLRASRAGLRLLANGGRPAEVWLADLRLQGQTPTLRRYIAERLGFGSP